MNPKQIKCPHCASEPGYPCLTKSQKIANKVHVARRSAAMSVVPAAGEPLPGGTPDAVVEIKNGDPVVIPKERLGHKFDITGTIRGLASNIAPVGPMYIVELDQESKEHLDCEWDCVCFPRIIIARATWG